MNEKYIIQADCHGHKYWVQLTGYPKPTRQPDYQWNGLKNNATVFKNRTDALDILYSVRGKTTMQCDIVKK